MTLVLDKTNGPSKEFVEKVLSVTGLYLYEYLVGERIIVERLKPQFGFKAIDLTVLKLPCEPNECNGFQGEGMVRLTADCSMYDFDAGLRKLKENLKKWLLLKEDCVIYDRNGEVKKRWEGDVAVEFNDCQLTDDECEKGSKLIKASVFFDTKGITECEIIYSPIKEVFDKKMESVITEGVCYSTSKVPSDLRDSFRKSLDELANKTPVPVSTPTSLNVVSTSLDVKTTLSDVGVLTGVDFQPNSKDVIHCFVDPSLYPFVESVSKFRDGKSMSDIATTKENTKKDFWNRFYEDFEDSKFQWLPTPFAISKDGKCSIQGYINDLNKEKFPDLYTNIEKLFEVFLPYFEEVWAYSKAMDFYDGDLKVFDKYNEEGGLKEDKDYYLNPHFDKKDESFKNKELQVITKIMEYQLKPGQCFEGIDWQADGIPQEHIVMTGIYIIDQDTELSGGNYEFKRPFLSFERNIIWEASDEWDKMPRSMLNIVKERHSPLGYFPTEEGYIIVYPNCHAHKITKLINNSTTKDARRRIVIFFVVDPEKQIISTREIAPQQDDVSLDTAMQYRLQMMAERVYNDEKLNPFQINLQFDDF